MKSFRLGLLIVSLLALCLAFGGAAFSDSTLLTEWLHQFGLRPASAALEATASQSSSGVTLPTTEFTYKKCTIQASQQQLQLWVNNYQVSTSQDPATGNYVSPEVPYRQFASLEELAQAFVDNQGVDCDV